MVMTVTSIIMIIRATRRIIVNKEKEFYSLLLGEIYSNWPDYVFYVVEDFRSVCGVVTSYLRSDECEDNFL